MQSKGNSRQIQGPDRNTAQQAATQREVAGKLPLVIKAAEALVGVKCRQCTGEGMRGMITSE